MIDDLNKELKTITQKWTKIQGGPCLWLRKWGKKPIEKKNNNDDINNQFLSNSFRIENYLIAISNGGGLIATYYKPYSISASISKYLKIFSPDLNFIHDILLKIQNPLLDKTEWYEFCEVSYIAFTPDELIIVLLSNFTILIFNNIGALVNFSVYKNKDNPSTNLPKQLNARLVSYSLAILTSNQMLFYIPDVRKPLWFTSLISEYNQSLSQNFDFIPLNDFSYPFLFYITKDSTINANIGMKSKNIKIPNHQILGINISPDFSNIACLMANTKAEVLFYVLFSDRQFTQSKMKRVLITAESLNGYPNAENIVSELPNFLNFCWCGKSSILINFVKYCVFVDISGGVCVIENPSSNLVIYPEIDGARIICQEDKPSDNNNSNIDKNQKKNQKLVFQTGLNFLSVVPESLESVFKKKNVELCQNYIEWTHGLFKEESISKYDIELLKEKTDLFIEASKMITEKNIQQLFLGTSWFFQSFLDPMKRIPTLKEKKSDKTFEKIRILHLLREDSDDGKDKKFENNNNIVEKAFKTMLITYEQMEFLTYPTIVSRLCNRGAHVTAHIVAKIVEVEKIPIFNHKALMIIYSTIRQSIKRQQENEIRNIKKISTKNLPENIAKKVVDDLSKSFNNLDYSQLAMAALKFGDRKMSYELLNREKDPKKKIPVFLLLDDIRTAFEFAVEYGDQKIINYVAKYAIDHDKADIVASDYNKALIPSARFDEYDSQQISLLIFMIRNMRENALLTYLFSVMRKKLLPPDDISNEIFRRLTSENIFHYRNCFSKYINLMKWMNENGDDQMRSIISNGLSSNVRPAVKEQAELIKSLFASNEEQAVTSDTNETKLVEKIDDIKNSNDEEPNAIQPQNQDQNQEKASDSESKQKSSSKQEQKQEQNQEDESKAEKEAQSESTSKSKQKNKLKVKSKLKSKQKNNVPENDNDDDPVQDSSINDNDSNISQSNKKSKKKKDKDKDDTAKNDKTKKKEKDKMKSTSKKKNSKKDGKDDNDDNIKETKKTDDINKKSDKENKKYATNNPEDDEKSNEKKSKKPEETKKLNDEIKNNDKSEETKKEEEKADENEDENKKKKVILPLKLPFLFRNKQKSQSEKESENKEEIAEEEEETKVEAEPKEEIKIENGDKLEKEVDQLQFNYFPKFRNNVSAMKAIEFELCNGRIEEAKKIATLINLPESRFIWLQINFYLRTNAQDNDLLQLCNKIGLIDGLWVVRRCIVLNRLNIAAAFLENISDYKDKCQAKDELQRVITSKQQQASKVDVKNIL